jgi:hypothetical protein
MYILYIYILFPFGVTKPKTKQRLSINGSSLSNCQRMEKQEPSLQANLSIHWMDGEVMEEYSRLFLE